MAQVKENLYLQGTTVSERVFPFRKLWIRRYFHRIYYCQILQNPQAKELAMFEREIMPDIG